MTLSAWVRRQALRAAAGTMPQPAPLHAPRRDGSSPRPRYTRQVCLFFTEEQFLALRERARACELPLNTFTREVLFGRQPIARRLLLRSAIVAVDRAGRDLKQLFQVAGVGAPQTPDLLSAVAALHQEVRALRDVLLAADAVGAPEPSE